jgi:hypothetical protein
MFTHVTRRMARLRSADGPGRGWVGPGALFTLAALAGIVGAAPAEAARICGDRHQILEQLKQEHNERPNALGLSADGGVLEVLVSPEGGWTILVTYPTQQTCVVAVGRAWEALQIAGEPA